MPRGAAGAAARLAALGDAVLVEEMIVDGVAEVLAGAIVDPQFGLTLVVGAGGVMTELLRDSVSLLPPFTAGAVRAALARLKMYPLLTGSAAGRAAMCAALVAAILAIARYAEQQLGRLAELDVNPLIVRARRRRRRRRRCVDPNWQGDMTMATWNRHHAQWSGTRDPARPAEGQRDRSRGEPGAQ